MSDSPNETPEVPDVLAPPPLLYAGALGTGLLAKTLFPVGFVPPRISRMFDFPLLGCGALMFLASLRAMRRAGTDVSPYKPTASLVVEGPYRFTRDPIYPGFTLEYSGIAALADSLWAVLLLPFVLVIMRRGIIDREEHYLERVFAEEYVRYKTRVRRWI